MDHLEQFHEYKYLLFAIAYRMLGSVMDAEDMVQETFLRWREAEAVSSPKAYLTTIITRLCIDHLRSARVQREQYVGEWLPEPLVSEQTAGPGADVAGTVALADSLSIAFLLLLESLSPVERAVYLLREVFDYEYAEIGSVVNKSEANCRQIASRARRHLAAGRPRFEPSPEETEVVLQQFLQTCATGDMEGLLLVLHEDVVLQSDGGGNVVAARKPILGADRVARFLLAIIRQAPPDMETQLAHVNGQPGIITQIDGHTHNVLSIAVNNGRIQAIYIVVNPEKLQHL